MKQMDLESNRIRMVLSFARDHLLHHLMQACLPVASVLSAPLHAAFEPRQLAPKLSPHRRDTLL